MSEKKKVISVMIPTYNEEENARPIYEAVRDGITPARSLRISARMTPRSKPFLTARTLVSSTAPITV